MIIGLAKKEDAAQIAKIHKQEISQGFLSSLHISFLTNFYAAIIECPASFCIVAKEGQEVIGFMSAVVDIKILQRYFLKKYFFSSVALLFKKVFSFLYIKKIIETFLYPSKRQNFASAELLTMAVLKKFQGQGVATSMLLEFTAQMKTRNVKNVIVLVGENLTPAISFYEKNGFTFLQPITLHGKNLSRIYEYKIP